MDQITLYAKGWNDRMMNRQPTHNDSLAYLAGFYDANK